MTTFSGASIVSLYYNLKTLYIQIRTIGKALPEQSFADGLDVSGRDAVFLY